MKRASLLVCAVGVMFCLMVGCASTDLAGLLLLKTDPNGEQVVAGSINAVAQSTKSSLERLGLKAVVTPVGEAVYVSSTAKDGTRFSIILTREPTEQGEKTRIRLELMDSRDNKAAVKIFSEVKKEHASK